MPFVEETDQQITLEFNFLDIPLLIYMPGSTKPLVHYPDNRSKR